MKYKQYLPTYSHTFQEYSGWLTVETEHYIFYYTKGSEAEKDIEHIKERQEQAFQKIVTELKVPVLGQKITYYFYPTPELKTELMGDDWFAQSIYGEFCIHVLYTLQDKPIGEHEDTHLLTLPWGISINFLQEGLAEYMVGHNWYGEPHDECVREGIAKGYELSPSKILTEKDWLDTPQDGAVYFYALAGEWIKYLIETFGLEVFKKLYTECTREETAETIRKKYQKHTGKSIEELEEDFSQKLAIYSK
ncbi:MAG: hypothetical protein A2481_02480 [Candidatus Yonathbacteria bacterium RIFOXYC2_FULL_47_9]|nr:MAG: hypothetical protein A2481_02480 [Candidatus Yonathbacteria bacterium RIFOXYC2_FULL_47_9]HAT68565.1 hypothetical protein [Candidatus Yonathbacteria bacterium]